jgi:hypothetical protein
LSVSGIINRIDLGIANYTALPYNRYVEFIEATAYTKPVYSYLTDDEYLGLQSFLFNYPESGKVIPGSGASESWMGDGRKR